MKITIRIDNIEITVDEHQQGSRNATMQYSDQNKQIQETIKVMSDECIKLHQVCNSTL